MILATKMQHQTCERLTNSAKYGVVNMTAYGCNDHIVFAFCVIDIKIILNKNTDTFRKSQVPVVDCIFLVNKVIASYTFQKGQNDHPGISSVK